MQTCGFCISQIQALLGDPKGTWAKMGYLLPLLNLAYGEVYLNLKNASGKNLQAVVQILNVPAGTTSLYAWQSGIGLPGTPANQPAPPALLKGLTDVIAVFVKPADSQVCNYIEIKPRNTLPHINPALNANTAFGQQMFYTFLGNKLSITPCNLALDIEVIGKFSPVPLKSVDDLLTAHEDVWIPTVNRTAAKAGVERSNPALLSGYKVDAVAAEDNIVAEIMRSEQNNPVRAQRALRANGSSYVQWYWGT